MDNPTKNDWVTGVIQDLEKIEIKIELIEMEHFSEEKFQNVFKMKVKLKAFEYLNNKLKQRESYRNKKYEHLPLATYLHTCR